MNRVRVTEQVVQVAEDLLVRTRQKDAEDVVFLVAELVESQARTAVLVADEAVDLPVGVAGHILQRPARDGSSSRRCTGMIGKS